MQRLIAALTVTTVLSGQSAQEAALEKQRISVAKMQESLERQKAAIRKEKASDADPNSFYLVPWPTPAPVIAPGADRAGCASLPPPLLEIAIAEQAQRAQLDPELLRAVIRQESGGKPCAVSPVGAMGLMQLMPATAHSLGVANPFDILENLRGGTEYLRQMLERYGGDVSLALAAYNAGPKRVDAIQAIPAIPETRAYVDNILKQIR